MSEQKQFSTEEVKQMLLNKLAQSYAKFIAEVKALPMNGFNQSKAFEYFDTGFLWAKEGYLSPPQFVAPGEPIQPVAVESEPVVKLQSSETSNTPLDAA